MKSLRWMSSLSVLLLAICAWGQTAGFIYSAGAAGDGVTGAPYTANVVNEQNRVLLDGNRIHHETHGKCFATHWVAHERKLSMASSRADMTW